MKRIVGGLGKLIGLPLYFLRSVARLLWAGLMVVSGPLLRRVDASPRFGHVITALSSSIAPKRGVPLLAGTVLVVRYLGLLLFSMVGGMVPGTLFSVAVQVAPSESCVSTTVGWMLQFSALGQFVGPPVVAWMAATTGGWQWTWTVTGAASLAGIGIAALIGQVLRR